ncbi:hypothetical protein M0802_003313 [Mischocyttarus mexicanus]|nr:hypothetical protein M0802_003313 [Mischocyttarus mexicanus]
MNNILSRGIKLYLGERNLRREEEEEEEEEEEKKSKHLLKDMQVLGFRVRHQSRFTTTIFLFFFSIFYKVSWLLVIYQRIPVNNVNLLDY